ncbi:MAG: hypothetical protein NZT92_19105 [Abditibacteriales bacterium]|nr:hypothetical protein [Abditibacteriales bacterium]MDW8366961.1 hypothetical protein [Abditibacteriales bacterium]
MTPVLNPHKSSVVSQSFFARWFGWRVIHSSLREEAYAFGNFTDEARRFLDRTWIIQPPDGVAWLAAKMAALTPRWVPGTGSWIRTGEPTGLACPPFFTFLTSAYLDVPTLAHEFTHHVYERLPRPLKRQFLTDYHRLLDTHPQFAFYMKHQSGMEQYGNPRDVRELHQRVIEFFNYGRAPMPEYLRKYYQRHFHLRLSDST